jgi:hypothetical protein
MVHPIICSKYIGLMLKALNGMVLANMTSQTFPSNKERKMKRNKFKVGQLIRSKNFPSRIGIILQFIPVHYDYTNCYDGINWIRVLWVGGNFKYINVIEKRLPGDLMEYCNDSDKL